MIKTLSMKSKNNIVLLLLRASSSSSSSSWSKLTQNEQLAWTELGWCKAKWDGLKPAPILKHWHELSIAQQAAAQYGLGICTDRDWIKKQPNAQSTSPSSSSPIPTNSSVSSSSSSSSSSLLTPSPPSSSSTVTKFAWSALKFASKGAPIVGELLSSSSKLMGKHHKNGVLASTAGALISQLPTMIDAMSDVIVVDNVETILYLDDSYSMKTNLVAAHTMLNSLSSIIRKRSRIVKFGTGKTILNARDDDWVPALVHAGWTGSSGGTYMWKMIEEDVANRYRPGKSKIRIVLITDGLDCMSMPEDYRGIQGMDPLMKTLLKKGYDIEWHICILNPFGTNFLPEESERFRALSAVTGGSFLELSDLMFDAKKKESATFLSAIKDSSGDDEKDIARGIASRDERKRLYHADVKKGKAVSLDWARLLPEKGEEKNRKK